MGKLSHRALEVAHGKAWADRIVAVRNGMPEYPDGYVFCGGCPTCAGYGMPGWIVKEERWQRCQNCNYDGVNNSGRDVYKRADQTHQVNGGEWMPK